MPLRFLSDHTPGSLAVRLACLSLAVGLFGCESPARQNNEPTLSPGPFIVSSPVVFPAVRAPSRLALSSLEEDLVYVSLPPGGIPGAISATIHDLRSGASVSVPVVNGGFDPVALPAAVGDTLLITVQLSGTKSTSFQSVVAAATVPVVVRTSPPPRKRDVPLNSIVVIVFSEPLDSATVDTGSFKLWRGTTPVGGTVMFADPAHLRVEFRPDALLASQTDYQLVLGQGIRDLDGTALDSAVTVPFTTGTTGAANALVFASVDVGLSHACGVTTEGAAYCWGDNEGGQLGNGTTTSSTTPVPVAGALSFSSISVENNYSCGVTTAGAVYCWGEGVVLTSLTAGPIPEPVAEGLTFSTVSVADFHACAVTTTGAGYCWGDGGMGDLGDGTVYGVAPIARVAGGHTFASISAGVYSSCGLTTTGAAYCWGSNMMGGLGTGLTGPEQCQPYGYADCSTVPVAVTGGHTFQQVAAKTYAACGLTPGGTTYCWGSNLNDNLGYHTHTGPEQCQWDDTYIVPCTRLPRAVPGLPPLASLSASDSYACGLTSNGVAYCWGYPQNTGDLTSNTGPVEVPGGLTFATLSTGPYATCGVTPAGVAYCWGHNEHGILGDGTTTSSRVPVKVAGQP